MLAYSMCYRLSSFCVSCPMAEEENGWDWQIMGPNPVNLYLYSMVQPSQHCVVEKAKNTWLTEQGHFFPHLHFKFADPDSKILSSSSKFRRRANFQHLSCIFQWNHLFHLRSCLTIPHKTVPSSQELCLWTFSEQLPFRVYTSSYWKIKTACTVSVRLLHSTLLQWWSTIHWLS